MPRKSTAAELQAEEAVASSPLRRSSRILSGTATTAAGIGTRRSSQTTESQADTPAKATRGRRASTQDNEEKPEVKPITKTNRASMLIDDESKKETESTPSRRGRKPSATTEPAEHEASEKPKPVRRTSTSAKNNEISEEKSKTAPVRGRRSSANLEAERDEIVAAKTPSRTISRRRSSAAENSTAEAEATSSRQTSRGRKVSETEEILPTTEAQKSTTRSRRKSINVDESSKPEEKAKPTTRGRRSSTSDLLTNISPKTPQRPRSRASNQKEDLKKSPEENKNDSLEIGKEINTNESNAEETTPVISKEILIKVTPLKKRKIIGKIESQLDLSVINESADDINISKNDETKLDDNSKCEDTTEYDATETPSKMTEETDIELLQEQTKNIDKELSKKVLSEGPVVRGIPTTRTILQNTEPCDLSVTNIPNDPESKISEQKASKTHLADNSETNDQKQENVNSHNISESTIGNFELDNNPVNKSIPLLEKIEPGRKRSSPKLEDTPSPSKSPRLSEKRSTSNSGKEPDGERNQSKNMENENDKDISIKEKSQASFLSSGSDGSFRFHLSNISMAPIGQGDLNKDNTQEGTLNTSNESNTSNKENIHQVDSKAQKELDQSATIPVQDHVVYRVSNVFKPNQKDYSFMEPMDIEENSVICIENSIMQNQNDTSALLDQTASENVNDLVKEEVDLDESSVIFNPKVTDHKSKDVTYLSEDDLQNAANRLQILQSGEDILKLNFLTETEGSDTNLLIEETNDTVDFSIMPKKHKTSPSDINLRRSKSPKNADTSLVINQHLEQVKIVLQGKSSSPITAKRRTTSLGRSKSPIPKNTQSTDSENEDQNRLGIVKLTRRSKSASNSPNIIKNGETKKDILSPTLQMISSKGLDLNSKNLDIETGSERLGDTKINHVVTLKNSGISPASFSLAVDTKELRNSSCPVAKKVNTSLRSPVSDVKRNLISQDAETITPIPVQLESSVGIENEYTSDQAARAITRRSQRSIQSTSPISQNNKIVTPKLNDSELEKNIPRRISSRSPNFLGVGIENEYTSEEAARPITRRSQRSIRSQSRSPNTQDNKIVTPKLKDSELEKNTTRRSSGQSPSFLGVGIESEYTSDEAARPITRRNQRSIRSQSKSPISQDNKIGTPILKHSELEKNTARRSAGRSPSFLDVCIENEYTSDEAARPITRRSQRSIRSQSKSPISQDNKIVTPKLKDSELEKNTTRRSSSRSPSFLGVGIKSEYTSDQAAGPITRRSQRSIRSQSKSPISQDNKIVTPKLKDSELEKNTTRRSSSRSPSFLGVGIDSEYTSDEAARPITRRNQRSIRSQSKSPISQDNKIGTPILKHSELEKNTARRSAGRSPSFLGVCIENEYTSDETARPITRRSQRSIQSTSPVAQDKKTVTPKLKNSELEKNTARKSSGRSPSFLGVGIENEYTSDEAARPITRRSQRSIRSQSKSPISQDNKIGTRILKHSELEKNTPRRRSGQSPSFLDVDSKTNDALKAELRSPLTRESKINELNLSSPDFTHNEMSKTSSDFQEALAVQNTTQSKSSLPVLEPTLAKQNMSGDKREVKDLYTITVKSHGPVLGCSLPAPNSERLDMSVTKDSATSNEKKEHGITAEISDLNCTDFEQINVQDKTEYHTAITTNNESDFNSCLIDNTKLQEQTPSVIKDGESLYDFDLDSDDEVLHSKNGSQVVSTNTSAVDKQTIANRKQADQCPRTTTTTTYVKPQSNDPENQPEVNSIIVSQDKTADLNVKRSSNDLKTRPSLDEFASSKLQEYLNSKIDEIEDSGSDEMEEEESEKEYNEFIDGMAEEGEEDTPSEDSNQIIDEGESVGYSSQEDNDTDDDYDANDSFICDEEEPELLSGEEYDLGNENKKKKKKSRIIDLNSLKDDEEIIRIPKKDKSPPKKKKSRIIKVSDSSDEEEVLIKSESEYKEINKNTTNNQCDESIITIEDSKLEDTTTSRVISSVITIDDTKNESKLQSVIFEESQLLDASQQLPNLTTETGDFMNPVDLDTTNNDVGSNVPVANLNPSFHNAPVANPNNSINTSLANLNSSLHKRHRKSSLSIQENILVDGRTDPLITERINTLVQSFCSTVKKGEISLNLSLEYENSDGNSQDKDKAENRINILSDVKICPNNVISPESEEPRDISVSENTVETDSKISVSFNEGEDLRAVINKKAIKRRLSRSVGDLSEELKETKRRKKDSAIKANEKINYKKPNKIRKQKKTSAKASKQLESDIFSFNIANQLITDVKNRPRRTMKPSILDAEAGNSWITSKVSNLKPSTSPVAKHEKLKIQPKIHPKDFKNQMLSSDTRVKRIDTKTLLKQKGAFT